MTKTTETKANGDDEARPGEDHLFGSPLDGRGAPLSDDEARRMALGVLEALRERMAAHEPDVSVGDDVSVGNVVELFPEGGADAAVLAERRAGGQAVHRAENVAIDRVELLHRLRQGGAEPEASLAALGLARVAKVVTDGCDSWAPPPAAGGLPGRVEQRCAAAGKWARQRVRVPWAERVAVHWTWVGLLVTTVAAVLVSQGQVVAGLCVLVLRLGTSMVLPAVLPDHSGDAQNPSWRKSWRACIGGHFSDVVALSGVYAWLALGSRLVWAGLVGVAMVALLGATLVRVAALQEGIWIDRLYLERVFRSGSLLVGLAATALWQPDLPRDGVPLVASTAAGALAYAVLEVGRVVRLQRMRGRRRRAEGEPEDFTETLAALVHPLAAARQAPEPAGAARLPASGSSGG